MLYLKTANGFVLMNCWTWTPTRILYVLNV